MTLCAEVSNLLNEQPKNNLPTAESDLNILTPISLLLGDATALNPGGWQPRGSHVITRYHLVQTSGEGGQSFTPLRW